MFSVIEYKFILVEEDVKLNGGEDSIRENWVKVVNIKLRIGTIKLQKLSQITYRCVLRGSSTYLLDYSEIEYLQMRCFICT